MLNKQETELIESIDIKLPSGLELCISSNRYDATELAGLLLKIIEELKVNNNNTNKTFYTS